MNIVVTGAKGFLGQHLSLYLASKKYSLIAASRGECHIPHNQKFQYYKIDLTDEAEVRRMLQKFQPEIIIHAAAMSKPDECEKDHAECLKQNVEVTKYLLQSFKSEKNHSQFIYISSDFIFGENGPHSEDDEPAPLNFYGESKLLAEQFVKQSEINYAIIRPVFIYGKIWQGLRPSFLHWVKNNLEQKNHIKVVSDQQRTPTFVTDVCKGIEQLIIQKKYGVYHLAGKDILSPFEMAVTTANVLNLDATFIENVTSETFRESVTRAKHSGLKINKAIKELNYNPVSFEEGVERTFNS
ncbi:MAG: SDR family oxidoreductase [Chitinophagaceae bacterium]